MVYDSGTAGAYYPDERRTNQEGETMKIAKRTVWGWMILVRDGRYFRQTGAAVGLPLTALRPEPMTKRETRLLRRRGVVVLFA